MPEITIDGDTYTCSELRINGGDEVWMIGELERMPLWDRVHLENITHINGERVPVTGGSKTITRKARTINLDTEETA